MRPLSRRLIVLTALGTAAPFALSRALLALSGLLFLFYVLSIGVLVAWGRLQRR